MGILLTPEELAELQFYQEPDNESIGYEKNIAKAQAKKIAEWGEEECDNPQHRAEYAIRAETAYYSQRRECEYCWHELEQEIKK